MRRRYSWIRGDWGGRAWPYCRIRDQRRVGCLDSSSRTRAVWEEHSLSPNLCQCAPVALREADPESFTVSMRWLAEIGVLLLRGSGGDGSALETTSASLFAEIAGTHNNTHAHTHTHKHTHTGASTDSYTHTHTKTHLNTHARANMHALRHACTHINAHTRIETCPHT